MTKKARRSIIQPAAFRESRICFSLVSDDDEIYGEKATRKFEFQIQVNRILQIFDEMIEKIETLSCIQEFVKDRKLMEKYFAPEDIDSLKKYCSTKLLDAEFRSDAENENISRLIQLLLSSDLNFHVDSYKDNVNALTFCSPMFNSPASKLFTVN